MGIGVGVGDGGGLGNLTRLASDWVQFRNWFRFGSDGVWVRPCVCLHLHEGQREASGGRTFGLRLNKRPQWRTFNLIHPIYLKGEGEKERGFSQALPIPGTGGTILPPLGFWRLGWDTLRRPTLSGTCGWPRGKPEEAGAGGDL